MSGQRVANAGRRERCRAGPCRSTGSFWPVTCVSSSRQQLQDATPTVAQSLARCLAQTEHDRDRDRDYARDRDRDRDRDRYRDSRDYRDRDRDRDRDRGRRRTPSRERERRRSRSRDKDRPAERPPPPAGNGTPAAQDKPAAGTPAPVEDEKQRLKRERLEAWKKEREAKKALDEAKAKALALASKSGAGASAAAATPPKLGGLNRAALGGLGLKGLPLKQDALKNAKAAAAAMDDFTESKRQLQKLSDMPAVDLSMTDTKAVGDLEADDDDDDDKMDVDTKAAEDDEEFDPLEAFMSSVNEQVNKVDAEDLKKMGDKRSALPPPPDEEDGDDEVPEDEIESTGLNPEDILALAAKKAKKKDIAAVDHSKINYEPFRKAFYHPPPDVAEMSEEEADLLRLELDGIKIRGVDCPKPITKWAHCGLPASCLDVIKRLNFDRPTPIQSQAIPAIMSGRDVIGIAKTGSGKTIAFLLPLFRHIKDQRPLENMEGPMALVMTPTRELAVQIHKECKPFLKVLGLRAVCAYGGSPIKDQIAEMKKGAEIVVCTPGRMIDLLTANSGRVTNLKRVTYLVLDEADRMFDMGFEPQVMKIVNNIRPDRQTVLFSATFPKQMDSLARKILKKPLEITVGGKSVVAPEIEQIVEVRTEDTKFNRLLEILGQMYNEDAECRTLIFVDRQESADNLLRELIRKGYLVMSLHGGKDQVDRDSTIQDFKNGVVPIITATSVAARGLDVKQLKLVVNYDAPNHMEDYVHRAGRTGRAGNKGTCVTFITPEQEQYSVDIYRALKASNAKVPPELEELSNGFLDKVKAGKAHHAGSGFRGKGLDKLDQEREAKDKAQRSAYGEGVDEKPAATTAATEEAEPAAGAAGDAAKKGDVPFGDFKVEIRRGPAPDKGMAASIAQRLARAREEEKLAAQQIKVAEEAAARAGKDTPAYKQAQSVVAKLNAQLRATKLMIQSHQQLGQDDSLLRKSNNPDATDFHAIVPINDYPQKARWRVTNKETMSHLVELTGASVTNKGIYYEAGKEPPVEGPPKLHLLIESNEEFRVEQAVREIKRLLIEASTAALQAEARNPSGTIGRYSVV